jgi:hypothetical protein
MDITSAGGIGGVGPLHGAAKLHKAAKAYEASTRGADQVDLSGPAQLLSKALALPSLRMDRVNEVKQLMESGTFETDARLEGAMQKFALENPDVLE